MIDATFTVDSGTGTRSISLASCLDAAAEEQAHLDACAWIKRLRLLRIEGVPFRRRFTFRGDSLWWFAELYLHRQRVVLSLFRTISALEALCQRERPLVLRLERGDRLVRLLAPRIIPAGSISYQGPPPPAAGSTLGVRRMDARATWLNAIARLARRRTATASRGTHPAVAAFVHRAFWRSDEGDGSAEAYIGPVLRALEERLPADDVRYVSVGPSANFRARRWWHPLRGERSPAAAPPIESFAPLSSLRESSRIWRERHDTRRALWNGAELRAHAVIRGCDCWDIVREELAGIALLQWPWSARIMDEAGAALDALNPACVVTYAEAGAWGRSLVLEARRRGIPSIGLQHGFIYRHWLNYLHEPDEFAAEGEDRGFPCPSVTLLFDEYTARHLVANGHYPESALEVTGSPRLDGLVESAARLTDAEIARARADAGGDGRMLVLVATKYREARTVLKPLVDAAGTLSGVHLAIKTHPAETPDAYTDVARGRAHVTVLPASAPLAPLLRASRAVVTVNSTVAVDAAVLDVPTLVLGLPNNLSPFVEAGLMAGAPAGEVREALGRILYDEEFRAELERSRRECLADFGIRSDGRAAARAAASVMRLARRGPTR